MYGSADDPLAVFGSDGDNCGIVRPAYSVSDHGGGAENDSV